MSLKKHTKRFHPDYEWKGWKCEHDDCDYTTEDHAKIVKHKKEGTVVTIRYIIVIFFYK